MKGRFFFLAGLAVVLIAVALQAAAPPGAKEWSVNNASEMSYGVPYELFNGNRQIGYHERSHGINLDWVSSGGLFEFRRQAPENTTDHRRGPIGPTEKVALWSTKNRKYIVYEDRRYDEIDLGWSTRPVYEWRVEDQTASNGRVHFALYNTHENKYLVYQQKEFGINLGWYKETSSTIQTFSLGLSAQPQNEGWVPYVGSFGQNSRGNLLSVQNASTTATLMFVKPGKNTNQCGDPSATVRVAPNAKMTAAQMDTLYMSATPRLPVAFLACLTTPTPQNITLTFLNLTYRLDN